MDERLYTVLLTKAEIEELSGCIGVTYSEGMTTDLTDVVAMKLEEALAIELATVVVRSSDDSADTAEPQSLS